MNESEFQRRCDEVVYREVYCCVSTMAEYILQKSGEDPNAPFSNEDIENPMQSAELEYNNKWYYDIWSTEELKEFKTEKQEELDHWLEHDMITAFDYNKLQGELEDACNEAESQLEEYKEIFEYWICSPWLIARLSERNEAVIPHEQIWCRCTTGQSISIDGVIREIVKEYVLTDEEKASLKKD